MGSVSEFNRMTVGSAAEVISEFKTHSDMGLMEVRWGISGRISESDKLSKIARATSWATIALDEEAPMVMTESGCMPLGRAIVEAAVYAPAEHHKNTDAWKRFVAGLRFDGFEIETAEVTGESQASDRVDHVTLRRMLPNKIPELDFREAENEVVALLDQSCFKVAKGHLERALSAFQREAWSSANGELRNFYENYLNEIAVGLGYMGKDNSKAKRDYLGQLDPPFLLSKYNEWNENIQKPQYVQGLMNRMHLHGGHPGLSDEEDATFRLQISLITARLFLRRYKNRKGF